MPKECDTLTVETKATWKAVSEPYWKNDYVSIDCEAQNIAPEKAPYFAQLYYNELKPGRKQLVGDICTVSMTRQWMDHYGLIPPFDIDIALMDSDDVECDRVTRTVPVATVVCTCIADAYVAQSGGGYNTSELKAEENGDDKYILLGFQLPADIDPATIEKLELEMYVKDYGGDYDWEGSDYYGCTMFFNALPAFNESTVNWSWHFNNSSYLGQDVLKTPFQKNAYYKILTVGLGYPDLLQPLLSHLTADKKLYFSWKGSDTWQTYSSKEGDHPPKLIIHFKEPE